MKMIGSSIKKWSPKRAIQQNSNRVRSLRLREVREENSILRRNDKKAR